MADSKYYKYLEISLRDSHKKFYLYSSYEEQNENGEKKQIELIDETDMFTISGFLSAGTKVTDSDVLFEYNKEAKGVFEKLRLFETKTYYCKYDEGLIVTAQNEKELEPKKTDKTLFSFKVVNYLGKTSLLVKDENYEETLPFEIIPIKVDYEKDYVLLTEDIAAKCPQILLDYLSPVNLSFRHDFTKTKQTVLEQFIFLSKFCSAENIEYLLQCIKSNPDRMLVSEDELKPFGTAPISKNFFKNPFGNSKNWQKLSDGTYLPGLVVTSRKYDSYNTPANQFIKFAFKTFIKICDDVIELIRTTSTYKDKASCLKQSLEIFLQDSFFVDVQDPFSILFNNQVLQKREGYSQIFNAFNMLNLALQLDWKGEGEVYEGQARNVALLYEYWLVFELISILKTIGAELKLDVKKDNTANMFSIEKGLLVSIKQGNTSFVSAILKEQNIQIDFYYNRTFFYKKFDGTVYKDSYSRPFRPDYTFAIYPANMDEDEAIQKGEVSFIHFDAKYRVTDITSLFGKEKQTNSDFEEEKKNESVKTYNRGDLLKMHTYNDAIRRTIGSYVLYPGNNKKHEEDIEKAEQPFKIYDELLPGVGAFAIRPGEIDSDNKNPGETVLKDFIQKIIEFRQNKAKRIERTTYFENMILQSPSADKEKTDFNDELKLTMIGYVNEDYNEYLKENKYKTEEDGTFYFYFRAIEKGNVYTLHKETFQAKRLRFTTKRLVDIHIEQDYKFEELEPWVADIQSIQLVTKDKLIKTLAPYKKPTEHKADYYYLVKAKIISQSSEGIVAISTEENAIISPYSPKIVQLYDGKDLDPKSMV